MTEDEVCTGLGLWGQRGGEPGLQRSGLRHTGPWGHPVSQGPQEEPGWGSPCRAVHLGLGGLQLAARPLPGGRFLVQLLPQPGCLRLQGSCPGPQGQLRPGLLLQQLLKVDGRMMFSVRRRVGVGVWVGERVVKWGLGSPGHRGAGPPCLSTPCSA